MFESVRNSYMRKAIAIKKSAAIKLVRDFFDDGSAYDEVNGQRIEWSLSDLDRALEVIDND